MGDVEFLESFRALPADSQKQVVDLVAFLRSRSQFLAANAKVESDVTQESFIGVWRDRTDMNDSSEWVRTLRHAEW